MHMNHKYWNIWICIWLQGFRAIVMLPRIKGVLPEARFVAWCFLTILMANVLDIMALSIFP